MKKLKNKNNRDFKKDKNKEKNIYSNYLIKIKKVIYTFI